jgi:hypothetical protein
MQAVEQLKVWYADGLINRNYIELNSEEARRLLNTEEAGFIFVYAETFPACKNNCDIHLNKLFLNIK